MKHALCVLAAVALLAGVVGCQSGPVGRFPCGLFGSCKDCPNGCQSVHSSDNGACDDCGGANCGQCRSCQGSRVDQAPPSGVVTYPYYTVRGPRDFLAKSPRPIGP